MSMPNSNENLSKAVTTGSGNQAERGFTTEGVKQPDHRLAYAGVGALALTIGIGGTLYLLNEASASQGNNPQETPFGGIVEPSNTPRPTMTEPAVIQTPSATVEVTFPPTPTPEPTETPEPTPTPEPSTPKEIANAYLSGDLVITTFDRMTEGGGPAGFGFGNFYNEYDEPFYIGFLVGIEKFGDNDVDVLMLFEKDNEPVIARIRAGNPGAPLWTGSMPTSDVNPGPGGLGQLEPNYLYSAKDSLIKRASNFFFTKPFNSRHPGMTEAIQQANPFSNEFHLWMTGESNKQPASVMTKETGYISREDIDPYSYPAVWTLPFAPRSELSE